MLDFLCVFFGAVWVVVATMWIGLLTAGRGFADEWPIGFGIWAFCGLMALICWGVKVNRGD